MVTRTTLLAGTVAMFLIVSSVSLGTQTYQARFHSYTAQPDELSLGFLYGAFFPKPLRSELGAELSLSGRGFEAIHYKGEWAYAWSFVSLGARLSHSVFTLDRTHSTVLMGKAAFDVSPFDLLRVFGAFGWYERFTELTALSLIPQPWKSEVKDHDFVAELGIEGLVGDLGSVILRLGTFDELDVFRLNNPFLQLSLCRSFEENLRLEAHVRYRILLGFGRLDELMLGFSLVRQLGEVNRPAADDPNNPPQ